MCEITNLIEAIMENEIRADLRIARARSGLSNQDVAHLLDCTKDRVSRLENGTARLKLGEIARLFLIYGHPFEETFQLLCADMVVEINRRLGSIPQEPIHWAGKRSCRLATLDRLSSQLQVLIKSNDAE